MIGYSQYLIMPKHLSKELAEPMNINWKTSSQISTGLRMNKCQSSNIVINNVKDKLTLYLLCFYTSDKRAGMDKCQSSNIVINNVKDKLKSTSNLATVIY